jgi:predicted alpha/beta-hydrolase family hydrolase
LKGQGADLEPFSDASGEIAISGFIHIPRNANQDALVLSHGAGANCQSKLLIKFANAFASVGFTVLRFNLPFREARPKGPPFPATAGKDRDGIRRAVNIMRAKIGGRVVGGGHSYGGRQTTMLAAEEPALAEALFLLSYPLHPPNKPEQLRTAHFPKLRTPAFFVHGTRDPFATISELKAALVVVPAVHYLFEVEGAGHDLGRAITGHSVEPIVTQFLTFLERPAEP